MSRLPSVLQPAWPVLKRGHRLATRCAGLLTRLVSPLVGRRGVPRGAFRTTAETVAQTPGALVHDAGPAEHRVVPVASGSPAGHWVFTRDPVLDIPARFTLELPDGLVVADFGAVVTAQHQLDYETSNYFGIAGWPEHPVFLRPRIPPVERVAGSLLNLTTRGTSTNYYHFLFDALPRYGIFEESMPTASVDAILVPHGARYQQQLLAMLDPGARLLQPAANRAWRADRLLVPSTPNHELAAPQWVVSWLRKTFPPRTSGMPRRLYLTRGARPNTRRYVQEAALLPELERRGFTCVDPGSLTVQEQIDMFHDAQVVVGPHGAALTNIVFCQPGVKVLELFAADYVHLGLWNITHTTGAEYRYVVADGAHPPGRVMAGVLQDVDIPPDRVLAELETLIG
ncbi:MAG TPA: glycosyltransferase 61 family protein [Marmoricola sp.]